MFLHSALLLYLLLHDQKTKYGFRGYKITNNLIWTFGSDLRVLDLELCLFDS